MSDEPAETRVAFHPHHLLVLIPLIALLGAPYFANRLEPRIAGMPFLLGWIVVWVLVTSIVMGIILKIDNDQ